MYVQVRATLTAITSLLSTYFPSNYPLFFLLFFPLVSEINILSTMTIRGTISNNMCFAFLT